MPTASVTLPCYNEEDWIGGAIESVLDQTYEDFELVIIDDGSTDDTQAVVEEYTDDHRVRYRLKENGGYPSAQSLAFDLAEGEYLAIMEADDLWEPAKLERQLERLQSSEGKLCHTNAHLIDAEGSVTGEWHESPPPDYADPNRFMNRLLLNNFICNPSVLVDSAAVGSKRFPDRFTLNSDHFMWLRIAAEHPVAYLSEKLTRKRFHGSNISSDYAEIFENRKRLVTDIQRHYDFPNSVVTRKLASIHLTYGIQLAIDGRETRAREALRQSIRYDARQLKPYLTYGLTFLGGSVIDRFASEG